MRRRAALASVLAFGLALSLLASPAAAQASFAEVKAAHKVSDFTLLDRQGQVLQTLRLDMQRRSLAWVPLAEMSPALLTAMLLGEDQRFYAHSGVDWAAVASAGFGNLWNTRTRGASTITMQLAGLLDDGLARPSGGRSLGQKLGQAWQAGRLERNWSKAQILEAYLNSVPFRGEVIGIHALSQTLFGKHPSGLTTQEAALAAALVRAPNAAPVRVAERACALLKLQGAAANCAAVQGQVEALLARPASPLQGEALAPHYARQVLKADGPPRQPSSLDAGLQRQALNLLRQQLAELSGRNVEDGAVLVLDRASGAVLAWVGSSGDDYSSAAQVDGVLARRQPGSTLKPFIYQLALEKKLITAASWLDDSAAQISTPSGLYLPQNYDKTFRGYVSARAALGNSLNVPAVKLTAMLGVDPLFERLNALGLGLRESAGFYGLSLALGSSEVSLLKLTQAYRTLANDRSPAAFIVADMLADNNARALTFGLDSPLATSGFAAVKTGTSKDMRDNWCLGFSERFVVGVWVGNASGAPMHGVSGISGAAPIWAGLMRHLHRGRPSRAPQPPAGVLHQRVEFEAQREPAREEWFVAGTEQALMRSTAQMGARAAMGIASPRDGSIFALDPDIPPQAQRIRFEGQTGLWELNGKALGRGASWQWAPKPGKHRLRLLDARGQVLQAVGFEVRGAELLKKP